MESRSAKTRKRNPLRNLRPDSKDTLAPAILIKHLIPQPTIKPRKQPIPKHFSTSSFWGMDVSTFRSIALFDVDISANFRARRARPWVAGIVPPGLLGLETEMYVRLCFFCASLRVRKLPGLPESGSIQKKSTPSVRPRYLRGPWGFREDRRGGCICFV